MSRRRVAGYAAAAALVLLFGGRWAAIRFTEASWFADLGFGAAYWTRLARDLAWDLAIAAAAFLWYAAQMLGVYRSIGAVHLPRRVGDLEIDEAVPRRVLRWIALALAALLAVVTAMTFADLPGLVALYRSATPILLREPVLGRDVSFYLARLPLLEALHLAALAMTLFGFLVAAILYALTGNITFAQRRLKATPHARTHLLVLAALLALVIAWGFQLDGYGVVGGGGSAQGALGAADRAVRIPASTALAALALVVAAGTAASVAWKRAGVVVALWGALAVATVFGSWIAPYLSDAWREKGDDSVTLALAQFADRYTRAGFGLLNTVQPESLTLAAALPADSLAALGSELDGLSPWALEPDLLTAALEAAAPDSARPLAWTVTVGRYAGSSGQPVLAALAVPEPDPLALERLARRPDWTELHRGPLSWAGEPLAVEAAAGGRAAALTFLGRLEPAADSGASALPVERAAGKIRFLAHAAELAVVGPDEPAPARAPSGLLLGSIGRRLLFAWALQVPPLFDRRTSYADRLLIWRDVPARLARLYPFATFGAPRAALVSGRLTWLADGYLASARFPLAEHVTWNGDEVNYLSAPYLATVDAVTGRTQLYLRPPDLQFAATLARHAATPALPSDSMPRDLRAQLAYPRDLFLAQATVLARHHGNPGAAAPWAIATRADTGGNGGPRRPADALALLALGGSSREPWRLLPLTDATGSHLTGIVAATVRPDGAPWLRLFRLDDPAFPTLAAAESRLSVTPAVVAAMADAAGPDGEVRRGALVAVPAAGTMAYAQFIYATPDRTRQPLLPRRVVLYAAGRLGVGDDVADAVRALSRAGPAGGLPRTEEALAEARAAFLALDSASRLRDWPAFGRAWEALRRALGVSAPEAPRP